MANQSATRIQERRGSISYWAANDIILGPGEPAVIFYDNNAALWGSLAGHVFGEKKGDGVRRFSELPLFEPSLPVEHKGRRQRDLSTFGSINNATSNPLNFRNVYAAVDKFLHPYEAPDHRFYGNGSQPFEVGSTHNGLLLTMDNISAGTYPLREKRIIDADTGSVLTLVSPPNGSSTVDVSGITAPLNGLTRPDNGVRTFSGSVTNTRPTIEGGNDTTTHNYTYEFRYPVIRGFTSNPNLKNMTNAQLSAFLMQGAPFAQNLGDRNQRLQGNPDAQYAFHFYPYYYGSLSSITQNGINTPLLGTFDILDRQLTQQAGAPMGGVWANVRYLGYVQKSPSGTGTTNYYDFN